jgi:hypothetical protein
VLKERVRRQIRPRWNGEKAEKKKDERFHGVAGQCAMTARRVEGDFSLPSLTVSGPAACICA